MQALEATSDEIVDLLLAAGSHFEGRETVSGATVFLLACKRGRLDLVQRMVAERPACINDRQLNGVGPVCSNVSLSIFFFSNVIGFLCHAQSFSVEVAPP